MKNLQYFCTRFRERHSGAESGPGKRAKFYRKQNFFLQKFWQFRNLPYLCSPFRSIWIFSEARATEWQAIFG